MDFEDLEKQLCDLNESKEHLRLRLKTIKKHVSVLKTAVKMRSSYFPNGSSALVAIFEKECNEVWIHYSRGHMYLYYNVIFTVVCHVNHHL